MALSKKGQAKVAAWKSYKVKYEVSGKKHTETIKAPSKLAAVKFIMLNYPGAKNVG